MRWVAKAAVTKGLSLLPADWGQRGYALVQERVTHSFDVTDSRVRDRLAIGVDYVARLTRLRSADWLRRSRCLEIGAGGQLTIPLLLASLGVRGQLLTDIVPLATPRRTRDLVARLATLLDETRSALPQGLAPAPLPPYPAEATMRDYLEPLGIDYRAPQDATRTGLPAESVDIVFSTSVFQYPSPAELEALLVESRRLLSPDGCMIVLVDLRDQYATVDPSITPYNYLRYSDRVWRTVFSSSLFALNRLRAADHLALFERGGFRVADLYLTHPSAAELDALRTLPLAKPFAGRPIEELAVQQLVAVLEK